MQANLNNVYRETAQVLVNDYSSLLKSDPVKAARLGIDVRKFFRGNPAVMREFANANNSTPVAMEIGLYKAIKQGFLQTFEGMASQYSQLVKDGKTAEAEKISSAWNTIISDLEAHADLLQSNPVFRGSSLRNIELMRVHFFPVKKCSANCG